VPRDFPYRRDMRLPTWDYRLPGPYAITLCTEDRAHRFGTISDGLMQLNPVGRMVHDVLADLPRDLPTLTLDAYIVMPNHIHAILLLDSDDITRNPTLGTIVQRFKSIATARYANGVDDHGWPPFDGRLFQRNYYDHIVRDGRDLDRCRAYIDANPANWPHDPDNAP
jgi:REP element-mobilizing transposase RayT